MSLPSDYETCGTCGFDHEYEPREAFDVHLAPMVQAYIACALWSSTDDDGNPLDAGRDSDDVAPGTRAVMARDCAEFARAHMRAVETWPGKLGRTSDALEAAGHDLWLNRNGHGCGFWDGDWPEPAATELDQAAKAMGSFYLFVGDDGQIHGERG